MIISKDLFIFGEHIFATIIPEVQQQSIPLQQQQQQQQQQSQQQLEIAEKSVDTLINNKVEKKGVVEEVVVADVEEGGSGGGGSLSQQETVAVVIVAAAAAAAAAATVATAATGKFADNTLLVKEVEQNLEQQQQTTTNGSIKPIKTTTTTTAAATIIKKEETGSIEGKKLTLLKKAKEIVAVTDKENTVRRPKEKLLVAAEDNTTVDNGNKNITEEETETAIKEEEEEEYEQQPLVQRNLTKLNSISSQQQQIETENPLVSTEDLSIVVANNTRNDHAMVTTPFITKNQEQQTPQQRTIQLNFQNINFSHGERKILTDISGHVSPGEVLAIMGPSGSGKTTLLDCLSSQRRPDSGQIFLNRELLSKKWRRKICYVLQEEIFFSGLTLRETVMYTAMLRLPEKMAKQDKIKLVDRILLELELIGCEQTKFGDYLSRGLSGGEKKRANIACELLTNPLLMLLDEPTSGLDSHAALSLMRVLKRYATQERKTVVISVHQPSSQMFHMFDKLLLLYNGQTAYFGDVQNIYRYFENIGVAIKSHYNPADFLLEQLKSHPETREKLFTAAKESQCNAINRQVHTHLENNVNNHYSNGKSHCSLKQPNTQLNSNDKKTHKHDALINNIINTYYKDNNHDTVLIMENESHHANDIEEDTVAQHLWCASESNVSDSTCADEENGEDWLDYPTHFLTQLNVLSSRSFKEAKPRMLSKLNWFQTIGLALMAGAIWFQIPRTEEYLHDLQGWMFFSQTYWMLFALFGALNSFPSEREVISKERRSGAYRLSAYYLAKMFAELPLVITLPTVYLIISYPMLGCSSFKLFFLMLVFLLLNTIVAQSVGFFIGAYCMDMNVSITLSALYTLATQLFGGYLSTRIPEGLSWIRYTSMIHYAYQNMQILEFREGPKISCGHISSYEICKSNVTNFIPYEDILKAQNSSSPLWVNTLILMMFFLVFRGLGYAVLRYIRCPNAS